VQFKWLDIAIELSSLPNSQEKWAAGGKWENSWTQVEKRYGCS